MAWSRAVSEEGWSARLRSIKSDPGGQVFRGPVNGREVVVKVRPWRRRDTLHALVGRTRGARQWHGAEWLVREGFRAGPTLALLHGRGARGPVECLILGALPGRSVLELLASGGLHARVEHAIARELGRQTAALAAAGRYNRDHKPSNLIVTRADESAAEVAIVDSVAIRRIPPWPRPYAARMLASLVIEPVGVGVPPRRALMARVVWAHVAGVLSSRAASLTPAQSKAARRLAWRIVEGILMAHGDPTPRVNPLPLPPR